MVLGRRKEWSDIIISSLPENLDNLFCENIDHHQSSVLLLTPGSNVAESWLNALNADIPPHSENENQEQRYNSAVRRPSVRERLVKAGIQIRKKVTIRAAPLKSSGLPPNYLNSKKAAMEKWVLNVQRAQEKLVLPELEKVKGEWETPREGERFKIIRFYF